VALFGDLVYNQMPYLWYSRDVAAKLLSHYYDPDWYIRTDHHGVLPLPTNKNKKFRISNQMWRKHSGCLLISIRFESQARSRPSVTRFFVLLRRLVRYLNICDSCLLENRCLHIFPAHLPIHLYMKKLLHSLWWPRSGLKDRRVSVRFTSGGEFSFHHYSPECDLVLSLSLPSILRFLKVIQYLLTSSSSSSPHFYPSFNNLF
jgi:hypothetical protein